jgi:hypothetical protein
VICQFHAMLLYEVLNNTITPAGHRVIVYLDVKRLVDIEINPYTLNLSHGRPLTVSGW